MISIKDNQEPLIDLKKTCPGVVIRLGKKRFIRANFVIL
jgi:hypothetical protein